MLCKTDTKIYLYMILDFGLCESGTHVINPC
jgi:hypothetical protein